MPSLKEQLLILLAEGVLFYLSDPCRLFKIGTPYTPGTVYQAIRRLEQEGLVKKSKKEKKTHLRLTDHGKRFIQRHREVSRWSSPVWDKKWRLVVFDIPEEKRSLRDYFRRYLKTLGFGKVQRSIWISPYDFSGVIMMYVNKLKLSAYVFQITADTFQGFSEAELIQSFWDIEGIHNQYLELIERYTKKQKELVELIKISPRHKNDLKQIIKNQLIWDYQSLLARDPHLPPEFLPADWGRETAKKFIESFLQSAAG